MSGTYSVSGLITGLDTKSIISQLMAIERSPITNLQTQLEKLEAQKSAIKDLRTQMNTLRNAVQDFSLFDVFDEYECASSDTDIATATISGANPVSGAYVVNVLQLASASTAKSSSSMGGSINPGVALNNSGITTEITEIGDDIEGSFTINGVTFTVDPTTDTLSGILSEINSSSAGVTATYDSATDTVTFANTNPNDTSLINFGSDDDDSNFLTAIHVVGATQSTNGSGSTTVTSTVKLGAVDTSESLSEVNFAGGTITAGTFMVNGVTIDVNTTDTLQDVLERITDSDAQVSASYDSSSDSIVLVNKTLGSRTVRLTAGTSNFLALTNLDDATQTAGSDAKLTINGGSTITRNTNEISDAISGVTIELLDTGDTTITVSSDEDAAVEAVNDFITAFNDTVDKLNELTTSGGALENDASIRSIEAYLRQLVFSQVSGLGGDYSSLIDLGISTGDSFDSEAVAHLELDEDALLEALREDPESVEKIFTNTDGTGIMDQFYDYIDSATSTTGFLYARYKSNGTIDQSIQAVNDRIDRIEEHCESVQARYEKQFNQLETVSATLKSQSSVISALSSF